ncbi:hypothetical protein AAG906_004254 [Vitis piasezkii]
MVAPNKRNVRGKTRGVILEKLIEANGANLFQSQSSHRWEANRKYCEKLLNEIGLTMRQHAPVRFIKQLSNRFRNWRCDLHKHFKSSQRDWDYLCDRFSSEEFKMPFHHQGGSLIYPTWSTKNGEMVGQIELFKLVHWKSQDGWINQEKVLGQKSDMSRALVLALNQSHFLNLDHHLRTQLLVETQQQQLETQQDRIDQLEALVQKQNQQHHQQFEEILHHLRSSQWSS